MSKFRLFIENFIIYGMGGAISKLVPLLMLPIVTRLLPDSYYYGLNDLSNTIAQFGIAIATMGMYDAVFRLFFEKEEKIFKISVCSTAIVFTCFTSFIIFLVLVILKGLISELVFGDSQYFYLVYLTALSVLIGGTNNIVMIPTRTQNKKITYLVVNTLSSILSYSISIPLLLSGYYVIALPLASVISAFSIEMIFYLLNKDWFTLKAFDKKILMDLLKIGIPLLPNFLIYWIFNSCDRIMIGHLIGNSYTGVYSVSARIGSISQLIYTAFAGGWQYFAFSTMNEENQVKSNSLVFEYLGIISFGFSIIMFVFCKLIFLILFEKEYLEGFISAPYLFMAPLMQMLFQIGCNQFLVIKKTWPNVFILSLGATINIVLNYTLIPIIGIEGASISTLIGYIVSDMIAVIVLTKLKLMIISKRFIVSSFLTVLFVIFWRIFLINHFVYSVIVSLSIIIIFIYLYREDILKLKKKGQ